MRSPFPIGVALLGLVLAPGLRAQQPLDPLIDPALPALVETYEHIHANPELSHREANTSALLASKLRGAGFEVTERVGKFTRPEWPGYGVVAILRNGPGPTVLVRADMDALPLEEKTGLPYASKVKTKNDAGQEVGVMHACGHDIHVTALIGTAQVLAQLKDQWRGTVMLVGQPAEETIDGAKAMLAVDLYARFVKPDYAVAIHDSSDLPVGKVGYAAGDWLASATAIDVVVRGVGGHAARPDAAKDPIVLASEIILGLQTIVSRENHALDPLVLTVGSIHGGTRYNIIPDEVRLQLSLRTYKEEVRQRVLAAIERIARGMAIAAGLPEDRMPIVKVNPDEVTPATWNDPALTARTVAALEAVLGKDNLVKLEPRMGSEDFGVFGLEGRQIPTVMLNVGAVDPDKFAEAKRNGVRLPSVHSPHFAPSAGPTIRMGVKTLSTVVLDLLKR